VKRALAAACALLSIASAGRAQLVFEKKEADLKASPSDKAVTARFPFHNAGNYTVHITDMNTSCGCTTATLEKRTYAPNEKGEITASFEIGDRMGPQIKSIVLETDDAKASVVSLDMKIDIPDLMETKPAFLYWKHGDAATPKTVSVKILNDYPINAVTSSSSDPRIKTHVETVTAGKEYTVSVTPPGDGSTTDALISISADYPPGTARFFYARARVR
jgi:hypothetical protein